MAELEYEASDEGRPRRRWQGPFTWTGLLAVGWVLYELTAQPAVGVSAVCIKFGWEDFRTALWLRRRDPHRFRARACFWLYTANGLLKMTGVAFAMTIAIGPLGMYLEVRKQWKILFSDEFNEVAWGMVVTLCVGMVLSLAAMLRALWLAWRHRILLFLHGNVRRAWRADLWPPPDSAPRPHNRLGFLLYFLGALPVGPLFLVVLGLGFLLRQLQAEHLRDFLLGGVLVLCFVFETLGGYVRARALQFLAAKSAAECWGIDPSGEAFVFGEVGGEGDQG